MLSSQLRRAEITLFSTFSSISVAALMLVILLSASSLYSAQIILNWNPNNETNIAGYKLYYGTSNKNYDNIEDVGNVTSHTVTGLKRGVTYFFALTAYNTTFNESEFSFEVPLTVPDSIPLAPSNESSGSNGDSSGSSESSGARVNHAPILDPIADITVNEGDTVTLNPKATDPDEDTLTFSYSGWMSSAGHTTTSNDIGVHTVTVTVSDGLLIDLQDIRITVNPAPPPVSNLTVSNGNAYEIVLNGLQTGAPAYIDRNTTYTNVPSHLQGATYIKTAINDNVSGDRFSITFELDQEATIYVAHDNRITIKPEWMKPFTDTGVDITTTDTTLSIYAKDFPAGEITLGGNGRHRRKSMYTIIVVEKGTGLFTDKTPPSIVFVNSGSDPANVKIVFSEPIERSNATNVSNYFINNGITISDASLDMDRKTVTLTTGMHSEDIDYSLSIINIQDMASPPNVINLDTTVVYTFIPQPISNLTISNGKIYEIVPNGLQTGATAYIGRDITYTKVPSLLQGATYIKTANSDKVSGGRFSITFELDREATIYIAHDNRITIKPEWMKPFTDTGVDITTTDTTLSIYAKDFPAGEIALGGNGRHRRKSMYTIIVVEKETGLFTDITPPSIAFVNSSSDPANVKIVFSEPIERSNATNVANYFINNGITISDASLDMDRKTVTLTTGMHSEDIDYSLSVINVQDLASPPNVIDLDTTVIYSFIPQHISNLTVSNGKTYEIVPNGLQTGAPAYIDSEITYTEVPSLLQGATYIKTANSDKVSGGSFSITFELDQEATIYVAHDDRIIIKPAWLWFATEVDTTPFTNTGVDITTADTTLSIYAKDFPAGEVTLGGNWGQIKSTRKSMYAIFVIR